MGLDAAAEHDRPAEPDVARLVCVLSTRSSTSRVPSTRWLSVGQVVATPSPPQPTPLPYAGERESGRPFAATRAALLYRSRTSCACLTAKSFRASRMREIRTSGLMRGEAAVSLP